ncbi:ABC transporter permease [Marinoscillum furvescens]|uniref:Transport permease protein n=1 Tax=Marinoscillum furvescens DSM 4134 TaxID=1122208 RepID=A0A3D9L4F3_MARFU|nr:ABC transporter permease [Marinoscillum furvescens]RED99548.1 lipopolysaccharide transport system permease protein [Marinoscillum furvescens DSM 4134]
MSDVIVIEPDKGWKLISIRESVRYRDLLYFLTIRSIKAKYAQSVLGVGWAILQPLTQTLIFTVVFGNLAALSSDGVPYILFSFVAMVPWNYFSNILTESSTSLIQNKNLISKVYFPRLILPLSSVFSKLLDFAIGFVVMLGFFIYYQFAPGIEVLVFPLLLIILVMTSLGTGMILSSLAVQYRDVQYAMSFLVRVLMYGAPVVYSIEIIPKEYLYVYALNPMVGVIEGMRSAFLGTKEMPWPLISISAIVALILFLFGAFYFQKMERKFADLT